MPPVSYGGGHSGWGPQSGYDCSGLVQGAFRGVHVYLPRTANEIVHTRLVRQIPAADAERGDLSAWGSWYDGYFYAYHIMFVAYRDNWVFGATTYGAVSGETRSWGSPEYFEVM